VPYVSDLRGLRAVRAAAGGGRRAPPRGATPGVAAARHAPAHGPAGGLAASWSCMLGANGAIAGPGGTPMSAVR
jgi:hypothetical protein